MPSAILRKSLTDLTRRRARASFTVLTLALAVASVGIFAVPGLMQQSMDREIAANKLADLTLQTEPLVLSDAQLERLGALPNVEAVGAKSLFSTRIYVGARRQRAMIMGVPDFDRQDVDVVTRISGSPPAAGTVLTDNQNASKGKFSGTTVRVIAADGTVRPLPVRGEGRNLYGGSLAATEDFATFYTSPETVAGLSGTRGYTWFGLRLRDPSQAAADRTVEAVRQALRGVEGFDGFSELPALRKAGEYPGKEVFEQIASVMSAVTLLALLSALVLLSNTMTTLIGEQTPEIAAMKAIGASRRQVARIYRRTALLLGVLGAAVGVVLGVVLANVIVDYFGSTFFGIETGVHVDPSVLVASAVVGLVGPPLAAAPAIRRASRLPLREALQASGSAVGGQGRLDALLRRVRAPRSAQIGLRGVGRRKRRTLATAMQVGLAVATLLALLSLGTSVGNLTRDYYDDTDLDVWAGTFASRPLTDEARRALASTPGVEDVQPLLVNQAKVAGKDAGLWGMVERPWMRLRVTEGRWYTAAEATRGTDVAVVGTGLAAATGAEVGDTITAQTAAGRARLRIVGMLWEPGQPGQLYMPLATLQRVLDAPDEVNTYWIRSESANHAFIDRLTTRLEDTLGAHGTPITTMAWYDQKADNVAQNAGITRSITVLGLVIVAISLVGLVNAITMGVLERTREIGMLRCVGARARDIRRIFGTEGLVIAVAGWLIGLAVGYALAHGMLALTESAAKLDLTFTFPVANVAITLVGTVVLAVLVLLAPVRRAVRFKPGEALRYA
ncbi:MAG TPA: FtsX-like permease family protein [Solirubrobacteraceae bacterium]|nr:FtsX-like permease family protein [Solirubrobacteraceae bacterium]